MSKAFSSKGSPKKFTLSWWTKLGERTTSATSESQMFFIAYHSGGYQTDFSIQSAARAGGVAHTFRTYSVTTGGGAVWNFTTTQLFRDSSAWYNFVVVSDTDNAIQTERFRLYINGQRVTDFSTATYPSSGVEPVWNNSTSVTHYVGSRAGNTNTRFDGYMAEMVHIDGQALTPSSFGETNSSGIWVPKDVSGLTFGTNGFHIDGRDSADLGDDESGQGNDFSTSGLAAHDQVPDSPTNNFAVLNPLNLNLTYPAQLSEGNLKMGVISGGFRPATSTIAMNSGKFYAEAISHDAHKNVSFGFRYADLPPNNVFAGNNTGQFGMLLTGQIYDESTIIGTVSGVSISGTQRVAIDLDAGKGWLGVDSDFFDSSAGTTGNPSTGANPTFTFTAGRDIFFLFVSYTNAGASTVNFGQDGTFAGDVTAGGNADANGIGNFKESVPSGYLALCTKNLGS
jgi:hypothetical protein